MDDTEREIINISFDSDVDTITVNNSRKKITRAAEKRIEVCILLKYTAMTTDEACRLVNVDRSGFLRKKWFEIYKNSGIDALLQDKRHGTKHKMTPETTNSALYMAKSERKNEK